MFLTPSSHLSNTPLSWNAFCLLQSCRRPRPVSIAFISFLLESLQDQATTLHYFVGSRRVWFSHNVPFSTRHLVVQEIISQRGLLPCKGSPNDKAILKSLLEFELLFSTYDIFAKACQGLSTCRRSTTPRSFLHLSL